MFKRRLGLLCLCVLLAGLALAVQAANLQPQPPMLQAVPTATFTGPTILVPELVNVRLGPAVEYDQVGVLISGQRAPAIGRSEGGKWIEISYPGVPGNIAWVYAPFVVLEPPGATLPIIEPPPTPTPRVTATVDPTFAAQFNLGDAPATRLPTFTPVDPLVQPTPIPAAPVTGTGFPPIFAILGFLVVGLFGTVISFLRGA
jgi:hypothetical protein